jgi:Mce-associated membrane protein
MKLDGDVRSPKSLRDKLSAAGGVPRHRRDDPVGEGRDEPNGHEESLVGSELDRQTAAAEDVLIGEPVPDEAANEHGGRRTRRAGVTRLVVFTVLPVVLLALTCGAAVVKYYHATAMASSQAQVESVAVARDVTQAMLTYEPNTVDRTLVDAATRLTGPFHEEYSKLIADVVIPGSKAKQITSLASVAGAGSVAANSSHAVVMVYVNQTVTIGSSTPTDTASVIRVTLDKLQDKWLVSKFEPI